MESPDLEITSLAPGFWKNLNQPPGKGWGAPPSPAAGRAQCGRGGEELHLLGTPGGLCELSEARWFLSSSLQAKHPGQSVGTSGRRGVEKAAGRDPAS